MKRTWQKIITIRWPVFKKKNTPGTFVLVSRIRVGSIDRIPKFNRFCYKSTIVIADGDKRSPQS